MKPAVTWLAAVALAAFALGTAQAQEARWQSTLYLYAGVVVAGELRVEDPSGNRLRSEATIPRRSSA